MKSLIYEDKIKRRRATTKQRKEINGGQMKYSFVLMLISPTSLATKSKFQKNICFKTRAVGLINIKTKECKSGRHL